MRKVRMNVTTKSYMFLSLMMLICTRVSAGGDVTTVLDGQVTNRFTCRKTCSISNSHVFPLIMKTRSQLECAIICSKREWCQKYVVTGAAIYRLPDFTSTVHECTFLADEEMSCLPTAFSGSTPFTCIRLTHSSYNTSNECALAIKTVLKITNDTKSLLVNFVYLQNLLAAGNELRVRFDIGTAKYISSAICTDLWGRASGMCATVLDSSFGSNYNDTHFYIRTFCVDLTSDSRIFNVVVTPSFVNSIPFSWIILRGQQGHLGNNKIVFKKFFNSSLLETAVCSGYEIKLRSNATNAGVMRADVISQNNKKREEIAVQTTLYQEGKYKIVSHFTLHPPRTVLLDLVLGKESNTQIEATEVVWMSDPCWSLVYISNSPDKDHSSVLELRNALDLGQRVRVRFLIDNLVILTSPDFVGVDSSQTVVAYVARVLSQKSTLGELVTGNSNQSLWTHYYITSNGSIGDIHSAKVRLLDDKAIVYWYTEAHNYSLVHSSSSQNFTSLTNLATLTLASRTIRVKVYNDTTLSFYSCHVISVINNGQEVQCQVNGQLTVNFMDGGHFPLLSVTANSFIGLQPSTECFQTVVLLAYQGSVDYTISCLGSLNSSQVKSTQPRDIDWLVAE